MRVPFAPKSSFVGIIDIGSGFARVALAEHTADGLTRIVSSAETLITLPEETSEHSLTALGDRLTTVCTLALTSVTGHPTVSTVYVFMHAPWATSLVTERTERFDQPTRITELHIKKMAQDALSDFKDFDMNSMMEAAVLRTVLSGYPVRDPEGKTAESLSISVIASGMSQIAKRSIESVVHQFFPVATLQWRSHTRAILNSLSYSADLERDAITLDIGVDSSHFMSVREGVCIAQRDISEGLRTILSRLQQTHSPEETLGYIRMLSTDRCEGDMCDALQTAMALAEPHIVKSFGEALSYLASRRKLAQDLVLITHRDTEDWLSQFCTRLDFSQFTASTLPFQVRTPHSYIPESRVVSITPVHSSLLVCAALVNTERAQN